VLSGSDFTFLPPERPDHTLKELKADETWVAPSNYCSLKTTKDHQEKARHRLDPALGLVAQP